MGSDYPQPGSELAGLRSELLQLCSHLDDAMRAAHQKRQRGNNVARDDLPRALDASRRDVANLRRQLNACPHLDQVMELENQLRSRGKELSEAEAERKDLLEQEEELARATEAASGSGPDKQRVSELAEQCRGLKQELTTLQKRQSETASSVQAIHGQVMRLDQQVRRPTPRKARPEKGEGDIALLERDVALLQQALQQDEKKFRELAQAGKQQRAKAQHRSETVDEQIEQAKKVLRMRSLLHAELRRWIRNERLKAKQRTEAASRPRDLSPQAGHRADAAAVEVEIGGMEVTVGGMAMPAPLGADDEADMLALMLGATVPAPPTPVTIDGTALLSGRELGQPDEQDDALEALRRRAQAGKPEASKSEAPEPIAEIAENEGAEDELEPASPASHASHASPASPASPASDARPADAEVAEARLAADAGAEALQPPTGPEADLLAAADAEKAAAEGLDGGAADTAAAFEPAEAFAAVDALTAPVGDAAADGGVQVADEAALAAAEAAEAELAAGGNAVDAAAVQAADEAALTAAAVPAAAADGAADLSGFPEPQPPTQDQADAAGAPLGAAEDSVVAPDVPKAPAPRGSQRGSQRAGEAGAGAKVRSSSGPDAKRGSAADGKRGSAADAKAGAKRPSQPKKSLPPVR